MPQTLKTLTVDTLWQLQRLGAPSLSPDGAQAVISATSLGDSKRAY